MAIIGCKMPRMEFRTSMQSFSINQSKFTTGDTPSRVKEAGDAPFVKWYRVLDGEGGEKNNENG
jgi:hypothetical protein